MSTRVLWGVVALLGVACVAEGAYIASNREADRPPDAASPAVDPIRDVDRWEQRLQKELTSAGRIEERIDLSGITSKVEDKGKNVAVTFGIPGLDTDSVKLDVNSDRIRLRYGALQTEKKGNTTAESVENYEKIIPLPDGVDPAGFTVTKGKDKLTLVFRKAERAS